jgi:hypothetical protein
MSHMSDLLTKWSHQTITIANATTSYDQYGNAQVTAAVAITALVQYNTRAVINREGKQQVSSCQILLPGNTNVSIDDTLTLPNGIVPVILSIEKTVDFNGNTEYVKVYT